MKLGTKQYKVLKQDMNNGIVAYIYPYFDND